MNGELMLIGGEYKGEPPKPIRRPVARPHGLQGVIHRAQTARATPPWLTEEHRAAIKAIYKEARRRTKETGEEYHVDHIVPKISKFVCGLHVPWNLEIVHWKVNLQKGANVWPNMMMEQMEIFDE